MYVSHSSEYADDAEDEANRDIGRLAIGAGLIAFLLPLLPLYGDGSGPFIFSSGLPLRVLISFLLVWWTNAVVVAVGILYLHGSVSEWLAASSSQRQ
jgi:hypothetical protein